MAFASMNPDTSALLTICGLPTLQLSLYINYLSRLRTEKKAFQTHHYANFDAHEHKHACENVQSHG